MQQHRAKAQTGLARTLLELTVLDENSLGQLRILRDQGNVALCPVLGFL